MRVVIHLERTGFQGFTHTCRDELIGIFLHNTAFLCEADYLLSLVLLATLANHDTKLLHTLKQGRNGVRFEQQPMGNVVHRFTIRTRYCG